MKKIAVLCSAFLFLSLFLFSLPTKAEASTIGIDDPADFEEAIPYFEADTLNPGQWRYQIYFCTDDTETGFYSLESCDSNFANCTQQTGALFSALSAFDEFGCGGFWTEEYFTIPAGESYQKLTLWEFDQNVMSIDYTVHECTVNCVDYAGPEIPQGETLQCDTGNFLLDGLCNLFAPSSESLETFAYDVQTTISGKYPFGLFAEIQEKFTNLQCLNPPPEGKNIQGGMQETDEGGGVVFSVPIHIGDVNTTWNIIDTSEPVIQNVGDAFEPYLIIALWLSLVGYVYFRFINFDL